MRGLDVSLDGRWVVAGTPTTGLFLFDYNGGAPFNPVWTDSQIRVYDDTGPFGSSRPVAVSQDGTASYVSAGTIAEPGTKCTGAYVYGCVFLYDRAAGPPELWRRDTICQVPTTDVAKSDVVILGALVAAGECDSVVVYTLSGAVFWQTTLAATVHHVALDASGVYLAVGTSERWVYLFRRTDTGFVQVWSWQSPRTNRIMAVDLALNAEGLGVGEDYYMGEDGRVLLFWPGNDGWDASDNVPCVNADQTGDVYSVAVAGEASPYLSGDRVVAGKTPSGDPIADQWDRDPCDALPENTWDGGMGFALAVDSSTAGCATVTYCFSAFGSVSDNVYLVREGDATVDSYTTLGDVYVVAMPPLQIPNVVAGSDDDLVYFFDILFPP